MISNKIREIVEQREISLYLDEEFRLKLGSKYYRDSRKTLSESIKDNAGISIISEIKPASPTLGDIRTSIDVKSTAQEMESAGVVGLSILTEPNYFNGSYDNLLAAITNTNLPCLMKDFVTDPIQIKVASPIGATNILLINAICNLEEMYKLALSFGLEPLIEIHNIEEIKDIQHLFDIGEAPKLIGVNNRDLRTLDIDLKTSLEIIPKLKERFGNEIQVISESGIKTVEDIKYVQPSGADAFLIGSSIMQAENIKEKILELRGLS